jgi:hypothetical protein
MLPYPFFLVQRRNSLELSIGIDIFFYAPVSRATLEKQQQALGFSMQLTDWKLVEFSDAAPAHFVRINLQPEHADQLMTALWANLQIPFLAYQGLHGDYSGCVRWSAGRDGLRRVCIVVADD